MFDYKKEYNKVSDQLENAIKKLNGLGWFECPECQELHDNGEDELCSACSIKEEQGKLRGEM